MGCRYNFFIGRYCQPVDEANGRCDCSDVMLPGHLGPTMSCQISGEYCYGVVIDFVGTPEPSNDVSETDAKPDEVLLPESRLRVDAP